jgi:toxin ParE1/3/4
MAWRLAENPRAARERLEINPPVRVHPYRAHVVIQVLDADGVLIVHIRHAREDWLSDPD